MSSTVAFVMSFLHDTSSRCMAVGAILLVCYYSYLRWSVERPLPYFPIATLGELDPKASFFKNAQQTVTTGLESFSGPFQIITGTGPKVVLPNKYADEIRNRPELDFNEAFRKDFFAHYPGFDGFRASLDNPELIPSTLRTKVTQSLGLVTTHLVDETTLALREFYGDDSMWKSIAIKSRNLDLVARLSSRVFLGKPICHNKEWLQIAKNHTGLYYLRIVINLILSFSSRCFYGCRCSPCQARFLASHCTQIHAVQQSNS